MYKAYPPGAAPAPLEQLAERVRRADAYIAVSGEYNHKVRPALAKLLDDFLEQYFYKPSAIVCCSSGHFGGVCATMTLGAMLAEMGMSSIPSIFPVPRVQDAFAGDGTPQDPAWEQRAAKFLNELDWYASALKAQLVKDTAPERSEREA